MLLRSKTSQSLEAFDEVVGVKEGGQVLVELSMALVTAGADRGLLDGAAHAFHLPVAPRLLELNTYPVYYTSFKICTHSTGSERAAGDSLG